MSNLDKLSQLRKKQQKESLDNFKNYSKYNLKNKTKKKFKTCFIFPIAEFEQAFGKEIWGHGLPVEELTDKQKENRCKWDQVRKNILDKGNTQSRAVEAEIDLYEISYVGYVINFLGEEMNGNQ